MNDPKPRYQPVSIQDVTEYDPMKGTVRAKRINYVLHDGTQSYITIPLDRFTKEQVDKDLAAAADHHDSVMSIKGPPPGYQPTNETNPFG